jgi:hypothetical protein
MQYNTNIYNSITVRAYIKRLREIFYIITKTSNIHNLVKIIFVYNVKK